MPRTRTALTLTATTAGITAAALLLAGCATGATAPAGDSAAAADGFPVTIEHAYGETTIEREARARRDGRLGEPRGSAGPRHRAGRHEQGHLGRRRRQRRAALGRGQARRARRRRPRCCSTRPTASTSRPSPTPQPDVILAAYSGLTQEEYDTLSKIAPVVAYPEVAWGTSVEDMIALNSTALGLDDEGDALIEELHAEVETALAAHPDLADDEGAVLLHRPDRPQPDRLLHEPRHASRLPARASGCRCRRSSRRSRPDTEASSTSRSAPRRPTASTTSTCSSPTATTWSDHRPAAGRPAALEDPRDRRGPHRDPRRTRTPLAASANPSPLSIGWGIDEYFALLAGALGEQDRRSP